MSKSKRKKQLRRKRAGSRSRRRSRSHPPGLPDRLAQVDELIGQSSWKEARDLLHQLDQAHPRRREVLGRMIDVCYHLVDMPTCQVVCERLLPLVPNDPDLPLMLAGAYMSNLFPALALRTFRRFLRQWPEDPRAPEIRTTADGLEEELHAVLEGLELTGDDRFDAACLHEQIRSLLEQGEYARVRELAARLLHAHPDFVPALNNLGEAYFREGQRDQAIAIARRVLDRDAENVHAISNLTRYLYLSGRLDEAVQSAERLAALTSEDADVWVKKAEALSCLGDDQGVLDVLHAARQSKDPDKLPNAALLDHLAAVAAMRLGKESEARALWKRARKLCPSLDLIDENLRDLKQPVSQRHAPWPYPLDHWIPQKAIRDLAGYVAPAARHQSERAVRRQLQKFLQDHPDVVSLVPMLLDRGDPPGRELAVRVAILADTPDVRSALRDFALGQRGPDRLRLMALQFLCQADAIPQGIINVWREGRWQETLLFGFELHDEIRDVHQPQVAEWESEAIEALEHGDAVRAERLLKRALELEPDAPDLLNNLSAVYQFQARWDEVDHLVRDLHQRHPDYFFGRVNMAHLCLRNGHLDEAKRMLDPLFGRKRLHRSELRALCEARIDLCLAENHVAAARSWLDLWEASDGGAPVRRAREEINRLP